MCDIAVCIAKAQDYAEMHWLVYEIKLGTSIVSSSTVYCKLDSLYRVCIVFYKHVYVFSVFVGDCKLIFVHLIIYSLARTVCIDFIYILNIHIMVVGIFIDSKLYGKAAFVW